LQVIWCFGLFSHSVGQSRGVLISLCLFPKARTSYVWQLPIFFFVNLLLLIC
jgi:hypothetical protein